jgi:opacity protein-like surface antigen
MTVSLGLLALAASAQTPGEGARAFVAGLGGVTFGSDAPRSGIFAAQGGVRLSGKLFAVGEFGRIQNLLPSALQRELDVVGRLGELTGSGATALEGRLAATYGTGAVRWMWQTGRWHPYIEGGGGVARLRFHVDASGGTGADATGIEEELAADNPELASTKPLLAIGGGIVVPVGARWSVEGAYRYIRVFTNEPSLHVNSIHGALAFRF